MRLFFRKPVRRLIGLVALIFCAIPFGMSVSGCKKALSVTYCDAGDSLPGRLGSVARAGGDGWWDGDGLGEPDPGGFAEGE